MKIFYDSLALIIFFILYATVGIFAATAGAMLCAIAQVGWLLFRSKQPSPIEWITLAVILCFGGATLLFKNPLFIKWKPTVVYWLLSMVFLGSQFFASQSITKRMLAKTVILPEALWLKLTISWSTFFFVMGVLNLWVCYYFSTDIWVKFKLFGTLSLTILFVLAQSLFLAKYMPQAANDE